MDPSAAKAAYPKDESTIPPKLLLQENVRNVTLCIITCVHPFLFFFFFPLWLSCNFRNCRRKCPADLGQQHWKPNAPEYGLDTWVGPRTGRQGDRGADSSHAEAQRTGTWVSSTQNHPCNHCLQRRKSQLRRRAARRCLTSCIRHLCAHCSKMTTELLLWKRKSHIKASDFSL